MALLTKSKYLIGLQCPRYLWTIFNEKDKIPKADEVAEFNFEQGYEVEKLAKLLYPQGINLDFKDFAKNLKETQKNVLKQKTIFEAGFRHKNCFSRADILMPAGDSWDIIEIKASSNLKDVHIQDVAFQKYVYEGSGLTIRRCFLLHLNKDYVRKNKLDVNELFVKEDITVKVNEEIKGIHKRIEDMFEIIKLDKAPKIKVGRHCSNPYPCPIDCWGSVPKNNIFCLYRGGKLSCELYEQGIETIKDIPDEIKLNDKQGIQKDCEKNKKVYVDKERIKHFLKTLHYPLYYLDFETFSTAVPKFKNLKPYSQVPFQFSLHVVESKGSEPKHYDFLYSGHNDPRLDFLTALKKVLGSKGSIVVYNQSFEINRLKELALSFPSYSNWVSNVITRIVDLLVPFKNFSYYNPKQEGSASLKKVLPALVGKGYGNLDIDNGGLASVKFFNMAYYDGEDVSKSLLEYCCLDTLGMVWIVDALEKF